MQKWLGSFHQLDLQTRHSAWNLIHFSSFEALMSLPYLIKALKGSENWFKTQNFKKNHSFSNKLVVTSSVDQARK